MKQMKQCWLVCAALGLLIATFATPEKAMAGETYVQLVARLSNTGSIEHIYQPQIEAQLFGLANSLRKSHGLPPLQRDSRMVVAARAHAVDMLKHHFLGHTASTGQGFDSRMRALRGGALVLPSMAENAVAFRTTRLVRAGLAQRLFQTWVKSPEHLHTLLSRDYLKVSTGVVISGGEAYADQIFSGADVVTNMGRVPQ